MFKPHKLQFSKSEFIERSIAKFGDVFIFDDTIYNGMLEKIKIVCRYHHEFEIYPNNFLRSKMGCPQCARKNTRLGRETFIERCNSIHNNYYDYSEVSFDILTDIITIICPIHGRYSTVASTHITGSGCRLCADDKLDGRYCHKFFDKHPIEKDRNGTLYFIQLYSDNECFYKIGITHHTNVMARLRQIQSIYSINVIRAIPMTLYKAFVIETTMLDQYTNNKYIPLYKFGGHTECINIDISLHIDKELE